MFYKETNFREASPIGKIPRDWEVVRLRDVLLLLRNGLTAKQNKEGNGYPVTRIETISEEKIDPSKLGYVFEVPAKDMEEYRLIEGDILFSHINSLEHIGKTAIYEGVPDFLLHGMNLLLLRPDKNKIYPKFLLYLLRLFRGRKVFWAMSKKAVNQASINQTELGNLRIFLPLMEEQQKIAEILSTVDEAIQKTNEIIAKTERLKKGLMQELLAKGIGHREFKDTEIGRIPKEWEIVRLGDIAERIANIISEEELVKTKKKYVLYSIPAYHEKGEPQLIEAEKIGSAKFHVQIGDVLFGKINPKVPKVWMVEHDNALASTEFIVLRPRKRKVVSKFLYYLLQTDRVFKLSISSAKGVVPSRLRTDVDSFMRILIPLPPLSEQQKIAEILSTIDKKLKNERSEKAKLERIKQGLMDLLLTGKIRVKVD